MSKLGQRLSRAWNTRKITRRLPSYRYWKTKFGMPREQLRSRDDRIGDGRRQLRGFLLKEGREAIEVGESIVRPFRLYRPGHG